MSSQETETLFPELQKKYTCTIGDNTLTLQLAPDTQRETLLEIKSILESYPAGPYHVWLDIGGQMIDTKKNI